MMVITENIRRRRKVVVIILLSWILFKSLNDILTAYIPATFSDILYIVQCLIPVGGLYFLGKTFPRHDRIAIYSIPVIALILFLISSIV